MMLLITYIRYGQLYRGQTALRAEYQAQITLVAEQNAANRHKLETMQSPAYVERQARQNFEYIVPGDIRFKAEGGAP